MASRRLGMRDQLQRLCAIGLVIGVALGIGLSYVPSADAARNASGTHSLPSGNPVTTNTTITSSWANNTLADISTEITNSLDRSGRGAMLAPLQLSNGTTSAPSLTFGSDTDSGLFRSGANDFRATAGGVTSQHWVTTGAVFPLVVTTQAGITATQSTANGAGITATGNGTGSGVAANGGSSNGPGVTATGNGSGNGLTAQGGVTGHGIVSTGGTTSGVGVIGVGGPAYQGGQFTAGTAATGATRRDAVVVTNGDIDLSGVTDPSSTTGLSDRLTPLNLVKAWGFVTADGAGAVTVNAGFNLASCSIAGPLIRCLLQSDMASANYAVIASFDGGVGTTDWFVVVSDKTSGQFDLTMYDANAGASVDMSATPGSMSFIVLGAQ